MNRPHLWGVWASQWLKKQNNKKTQPKTQPKNSKLTLLCVQRPKHNLKRLAQNPFVVWVAKAIGYFVYLSIEHVSVEFWHCALLLV